MDYTQRPPEKANHGSARSILEPTLPTAPALLFQVAFGNILLCPLTLGITVQSLHEFTKSHRLEESEISYVASIVLCRLSGNTNFADYVDYVS